MSMNEHTLEEFELGGLECCFVNNTSLAKEIHMSSRNHAFVYRYVVRGNISKGISIRWLGMLICQTMVTEQNKPWTKHQIMCFLLKWYVGGNFQKDSTWVVCNAALQKNSTELRHIAFFVCKYMYCSRP